MPTITALSDSDHRAQLKVIPDIYIRQWQDADFKWVSDDYTLDQKQATMWVECKPVIQGIPQRVVLLETNKLSLVESVFDSTYYSHIVDIGIDYIHKPRNEHEYRELFSAYMLAKGNAKNMLRAMVCNCELSEGFSVIMVCYNE